MTDFRIGQGLDVHQFVENRPLILGGIEIPHNKGLKGHSDADALLHSIVDALLGATALGDIGKHFPDTDPAFKGISSKVLLERVYTLVKNMGWKIVNLDSSIMTESPKLRPYIDSIRASIAETLDLNPDCCSVKATTAEKLGALGRGEGLFVTTVVLLSK
jgi:2-C-methyl-D-erythritol 2,4-cyclodiphosphate synthase